MPRFWIIFQIVILYQSESNAALKFKIVVLPPYFACYMQKLHENMNIVLNFEIRMINYGGC